MKYLRHFFYLLLVCSFGVGCSNNDIKYSENDECFSFETKEAVILNINTEEFKEGDILAVGDSGKLLLATPEDVDRIVGIVKNKLQIFISKIRAWDNAL